MKSRSHTLRMLIIREHFTPVFSSTAFGGMPETGDYLLLYTYWYRTPARGVLQVVARTAIPVHKAPKPSREKR